MSDVIYFDGRCYTVWFNEEGTARQVDVSIHDKHIGNYSRTLWSVCRGNEQSAKVKRVIAAAAAAKE